MKRKLVIDSSDEGRTEIHYYSLSLQEINSRIRAYEKKYGMRFSRFISTFSCDAASPDEMGDYMDWEILTEERADRPQLATKKTLSRR